ncbi:hypothetical protein HA402_004494 [Bradysia odoriphaga]|nr:hypothetical protein HA402_004494 [Bradysia odoriphaga]
MDLNEAIDVVNNAVQEHKECKNVITNLKERCADLIKDSDLLKKHLKDEKFKNNNLIQERQTQEQKNESDNKELYETFKTLETAHTELRKQVEKLDVITAERNNLNRQNEVMTSVLDSYRSGYKELQKKDKDRQTEITELTIKITKLTREITELTREKTERKKEMEKMTQEMEKMTQEISTLKADVQNLTHKNKDTKAKTKKIIQTFKLKTNNNSRHT